MSQLPAKPRIGWIGAGRMGAKMCGRLLDAGYDVSIWNRTPEKARPLVARGATLVGAPVDLASCDVVFIMVSASPQLSAVTVGTDGVLTHPDAAPSIVVDCSTVSPETSAEVREAAARRGGRLLAAPVSGNPKTVGAGRATFAVSGEREAFDAVRPLLLALGADATYVGDGETARLVKICHNVFLGVVIQSLAEVTVLAERGGVSRSDFLQFLNESVLGSTFTRYKTPALVNLDFTPTFTPTLLRKDLDLGLDEARQVGVSMPLAAHVRDIVDEMIAAGSDDVDFAALLLRVAEAAGVQLQPEGVPVSDGLGTVELTPST